jgi:hypothetical protein
MRIASVVLAAAMLAAPAFAQELSNPQTHRFTSSEAGALGAIEIHAADSRHGRMIFALRPGSEPPASLAYTDDIRTQDATYAGNDRARLVPGAKGAVSLFQVLPGETHRYSATLAGLCPGDGIPFIGIEPSRGSIRQGAFDATAPVRLYVIEETFGPGKIIFTLCKAIDLKPAARQ